MGPAVDTGQPGAFSAHPSLFLWTAKNHDDSANIIVQKVRRWWTRLWEDRVFNGSKVQLRKMKEFQKGMVLMVTQWGESTQCQRTIHLLSLKCWILCFVYLTTKKNVLMNKNCLPPLWLLFQNSVTFALSKACPVQVSTFRNKGVKPGVVEQAFISNREARAEGSLWVPEQPGLHLEFKDHQVFVNSCTHPRSSGKRIECVKSPELWEGIGKMMMILFCRQGFSVQPWMSWNSLCRPDWPQTQRSSCFCL